MKQILITISCILCCNFIFATDIIVSSKGKIKTLSQAKKEVKKLRDKGEKGNINVIIEDGIYTLDETLIFGLEDAAPKGSITQYIAAKGAKPIISGGRSIVNWHKLKKENEELPLIANGNIWVADVSWAKGKKAFHCLYNGDKRLLRARSKEVFNATVNNNAKAKYAGRLSARKNFTFDKGVRSWNNLNDVEVFMSPSVKWMVNYLPLLKVDELKKQVETAIPATYTIRGKFYVENVLRELDEPGEWVLDSNQGKLYYWPRNGKPGNNIIAPALSELIRVAGDNDEQLDGKKDNPIEGLVFKGLTFSYADRQVWQANDKGLQHDWNMWNKENGLLRFDGAKNCKVISCVFTNSGSDGVRLDRFCQKITVEKCRFNQLGGTAVLLAGYGPGLKNVNHHNQILDNEIFDVGVLFLHSPGIFIWQSGNNKIANNHIYDQGYSGIVVAGVRRRFFEPIHHNRKDFKRWIFSKETREHSSTIRWDEIDQKVNLDWSDYEPYMHARENIIEYNELHDCLKLLHDGNCIYLSGNGKGNIVRYNVTYNHPEGAMIRTDDDSHGGLITHNILFGTTGEIGIKIKGLNTTTHNLFINSLLTTGGAGNTVDLKSKFTNNVFYHTKTNLSKGFHYKLDNMENGRLNNNLYYHVNENLANKTLKDQQLRSENENDKSSFVSNPLFINIEKGNFNFKKGSKAYKIIDKPITIEIVNKIGCSSNPFINRYNSSVYTKIKSKS